MAIVYKHINKTTGKVYIGCTKFSIEKRWDEHVYNRCVDYKFSRAINVPQRTIDRLLKTGNYSTKYNLNVEYI